jgi:hypothetical protein
MINMEKGSSGLNVGPDETGAFDANGNINGSPDLAHR